MELIHTEVQKGKLFLTLTVQFLSSGYLRKKSFNTGSQNEKNALRNGAFKNFVSKGIYHFLKHFFSELSDFCCKTISTNFVKSNEVSLENGKIF